MIKILIYFLLFGLIFSPNFSYARIEAPGAYTINATKNATYHNNLGLIALEEQDYYGAIEEFNIAIQLNPRTHATAVYYNNLGETYYRLGEYNEAQNSFEKAITQFNLNLMFYQNLVKCFKSKGVLKAKIDEYKIKGGNNPLSNIILGLCYIEDGQVRDGIIILDSFCMAEPDLIISTAIKAYLKELVKTLN